MYVCFVEVCAATQLGWSWTPRPLINAHTISGWKLAAAGFLWDPLCVLISRPLLFSLFLCRHCSSKCWRCSRRPLHSNLACMFCVCRINTSRLCGVMISGSVKKEQLSRNDWMSQTLLSVRFCCASYSVKQALLPASEWDPSVLKSALDEQMGLKL